MKKILICTIFITIITFSYSINAQELKKNNIIELTLIPPDKITDKINLDIRGGVVNKTNKKQFYKATFYWDKKKARTILYEDSFSLQPGESHATRKILSTLNKVGKHEVIFEINNEGKIFHEKKNIEIIHSSTRSTKQITGAWVGIYHWSEKEGKHWNPDIKKMTYNQWKELVDAMHKISMNTIVIQEVFRNDKRCTAINNYDGKAFYPSKLYSGRMEITAKDPIEDILSEADKLKMNVFVGIGMFAWFDYTPLSLLWHKQVAKELWDKYGHHHSFYGFYISEEGNGSLDSWEKRPDMKIKRKHELVDFFKEFKYYCNQFAPSKPIMLATNSYDILQGIDTYPTLLRYLDILCPFGFARMPQGDLKGKTAASLLQQICDKSNAHLWLDLEAFSFNSDNSLYPRPIDEIIHDLTLFDNFENILCYQFPGVFNDPKMSIRIGEPRTINLFNSYKKYIKK